MTPDTKMRQPCPFCGGINLRAYETNHFTIVCNTCWAEGPAEESPEAAIAAWNRRSTHTGAGALPADMVMAGVVDESAPGEAQPIKTIDGLPLPVGQRLYVLAAHQGGK